MKKLIEYRQIFKNFSSLMILQGTNFIIPILIIPFLINKIGIDKYGVIALAQTTMIFLFVIIDYGFSLSAVREISLHKQDTTKISEILTEVYATKLVLILASFIVLLILLPLHPKFRSNFDIFVCSYVVVLGQAVVPSWLFQGLDSMKYLTIVNLVSKIIFTCLIFFIVKDANDAIYVNPMLGLGNLVAGGGSLFFLMRRYDLTFITNDLKKKVVKQLREGYFYFVSQLSICIYMNCSVVILSYFVNDHFLGVYSVAEKIAMSFRQILALFSQSIYTHLCQLWELPRERMRKFISNVFVPFLSGIFLLCIVLIVCAPLIARLFTNSDDDILLLIMQIRILAIVPPVVCLNIPFYQVLLLADKGLKSSKIMSIGAIICISVNLILTPHFFSIGTCISIVITEVFITTIVILMVQRNSKLSFMSKTRNKTFFGK